MSAYNRRTALKRLLAIPLAVILAIFLLLPSCRFLHHEGGGYDADRLLQTTSTTLATARTTPPAAAETRQTEAGRAPPAENPTESTDVQDPDSPTAAAAQDPDGSKQQVTHGLAYTTAPEVALYIHLYNELPPNFITKKEAKAKGWVAREGNLDEVLPGMSIGGDRFGNREGQLPEKKGRHYFECDIDYTGGRRGAKRLVYSDDGLIFYTEDHYASFTKLYG